MGGFKFQFALILDLLAMPYYAVAVLGLGYDSLFKFNSSLLYRLHKSKIVTFELSMISGVLYTELQRFLLKTLIWGVLIRANFGPTGYALLCCGSLRFGL